MGRVEGKIVIVTGGASGVGAEDARLLAREGARVVLTDVNADAGASIAREIGSAATFISHDVSSEDDWKAVIASTNDRYGRLDALVNNAGILQLGTIEDASLEQYRKVNQVNAEG